MKQLIMAENQYIQNSYRHTQDQHGGTEHVS